MNTCGSRIVSQLAFLDHLLILIVIMVIVQGCGDDSRTSLTSAGELELLLNEEFLGSSLDPYWALKTMYDYPGFKEIVSGSECLPGEGNCILFHDGCTIQWNFDDRRCRGKRLRVRGMIKTRNITPRVGHPNYKAAHFHLAFVSSGDTLYFPNDATLQAFVTNSESDHWHERGFTVDIPEDANGVHIFIGIQDNTGEMWADKISVEALQK